MENQTAVDVIVIGAGPAGLVACKALQDAGLSFRALEKSNQIGGIWRGDGTGHTWSGMISNLSAEKCAFSDLPHAADVGDFPTAGQMLSYLSCYADTFRLREHIALRSQVTRVDKSSHDALEGWELTVLDLDTRHQRLLRCRRIIVASGFFSVPFVPAALESRLRAAGVRVHVATGFRVDSFAPHVNENSNSEGSKRVLVVGVAYSGADLAVALSARGHAVDAVVHTPRWYLSRYIQPQSTSHVAWDRALEQRTQDTPDTEAAYRNAISHAARHSFMMSMLANPGDVHEALKVDPASMPAQVVIADGFVEAVRDGRIRPVTRNVIEKLIGPDELARTYSDVIFATGYRCVLGFLPRELLAAAEHDPDNDFLPLILYKSTLHPTDHGIGFVGLYRGAYFASLEVQARWIAALFAGRARFPDFDRLQRFLKVEREVRLYSACTPGEIADATTMELVSERRLFPHAFPHPNYIEFTDCLAAEYGAAPSLVDFPFLRGSSVVAAHYRCRDDGCSARLPLDHASMGLIRVQSSRCV